MVFIKCSHLSLMALLLVLLGVAYTVALKSYAVPNPDFNVLGNHPTLEPRSSFDEEYKLFLEELDNGTVKSSGKSRQKRYAYLNTETVLDVGYLIVVPVTIVLPSMSSLFNVWRRKRSLDNFNETGISEETNPIFKSQVERISAYFELMNVPEKACQLRAICELSAEPSNYFPLSDVIISKIRVPTPGNPTMNENSSLKPSLFQLYAKAADDGATLGKQECDSSYAKSCKYSIDKLLNMPVMKFWNKVQSKLRLKFEDDSYSMQ